MSDDDDVVFVKKSRSVHYGSLEEQERARLAARDEGAPRGTELGDIQISNEYMELDDEMAKDKQALLEEFERRRKARQLNVSTDDDEVRRSLRQLGEPVCLFGEGPAERRVRLRDLLSFLGEDAIHKKMEEEEARMQRDRGREGTWYHEGPPELREARLYIARYSLPRAKESLGEDAIHKKMEEEEARMQRDRGREGTWYHEGPPELREARLYIARYSLPRAKERLALARKHLEQAGSVRAAARQDAQRRASAVTIYCSQIGDTRPISFCRFSNDSKMLATSSWSGLCKVWSVPDCQQLQVLRGHTCNVSCVVFSPNATLPQHFQDKISKESSKGERDDTGEGAGADAGGDAGGMDIVDEASETCAMASCSYDGAVNLWNFVSEEPMGSLDGHAPHRVSRVEFHPSGRFLGTACFDASWRLWDLHAAAEVLHQEGHAKSVYCIAFQGDGSLAVTGGMDAFGRVWDLRTGRCVMFLEGHLDGVLGADWSPAGHQLATSAADNSVRLWDVRRRAPLYTLPAHTDLVGGVRFQRSNGHYLLTSSYDRSAKLWSHPAWHPLKTLSGHDNKVMGADISYDNKYIATCSYDRTFKLWAPDLA